MTEIATPTAATRTWITEISDTCDFGLFNLPLGTCSFVVVDDNNDKLRSEEKHEVRQSALKIKIVCLQIMTIYFLLFTYVVYETGCIFLFFRPLFSYTHALFYQHKSIHHDLNDNNNPHTDIYHNYKTRIHQSQKEGRQEKFTPSTPPSHVRVLSLVIM